MLNVVNVIVYWCFICWDSFLPHGTKLGTPWRVVYSQFWLKLLKILLSVVLEFVGSLQLSRWQEICIRKLLEQMPVQPMVSNYGVSLLSLRQSCWILNLREGVFNGSRGKAILRMVHPHITNGSIFMPILMWTVSICCDLDVRIEWSGFFLECYSDIMTDWNALLFV